jgi:isonocardicin synthase
MGNQRQISPDIKSEEMNAPQIPQGALNPAPRFLQVEDRLGDYVSEMLRFLGQNLVSDNRLLKTVSLHVNASTGDIDLEVTDEEHVSKQHLMVSQENEDCLRQSRMETSRARIRQSRAMIADGKWAEALQDLRQLESELSKTGESDLLQSLQRMTTEIAYFIQRKEKRAVSSQRQMVSIRQRAPCELVEHHWMQPQTIFVLSCAGRQWLGRKLLSEEWISGNISELFCSKIKSEMLLGELVSMRTTQDAIVAYYRPASANESQDYFDTAVGSDDAELLFPFVHLTQTEKLEVVSPVNGWSVDHSMRDQLFNGEAALRNFAVKALRGYVPADALIYDPACSTGDFLRIFQNTYPGTRSFGQDLSAEMIDFARTQLDQTYVGDAINSPLAPESVDIAFVRFLNSEVVSTDYAMRLFDAILPRVKPGGMLVIFGHTPVLLDSGFFENRGLCCLRKIGRLDSGEIFQFYMLRKS